MQTKKERILVTKLAIGSADKCIEQCDDLLTKLATHTGKLVDNRFFKKHYLIPGEYRDWTKYRLAPAEYKWSSYKHRIMLERFVQTSEPDFYGHTHTEYGDWEQIYFDTRETAHIIERIKEFKLKMQDRLVQKYDELAKLETVNNDVIIADLLAVYKKYNAPITWLEILDTYELKHPKEL